MREVCWWSHTAEWLLDVRGQTRLSNEWLVTLLVMSIDRLGQIGSVTAPLGMVAPTPAFGVI